jgi:predicted glycoside hydrolase/deacetylase ChbG (UPF0249 family)
MAMHGLWGTSEALLTLATFSQVRILSLVLFYFTVILPALLCFRSFLYHAAQRSKQIGLPLGLHLNLTEGPPIANVEKVSSLVRSQVPWWPSASTAAQDFDPASACTGANSVLHMRGKSGLRESLNKCEISMEEVGIEVEAQIAAFMLLTGAAPTYLDGHQHVHVLPGVASVVARIAANAGIKWVRIPDEAHQHFEGHVDAPRAAFYRTVISQAADARAVYADEGITSPETFVGFGVMGADCTYDRLLLRLQAVLNDAEAAASARASRPRVADECDTCAGSRRGGVDTRGSAVRDSQSAAACGSEVYIAEYMCHVGLPSAHGDVFSQSDERKHELLVLSLPELREWLLRQDIELCSYHSLPADGKARGHRALTACGHCLAHPCAADAQSKAGDREGSGKGEGEAGDVGLEAKGDVKVKGTRSEEEAKGNSRTSVRTKRHGNSGRLLILSSMTAATGNATTALRLAAAARVL